MADPVIPEPSHWTRLNRGQQGAIVQAVLRSGAIYEVQRDSFSVDTHYEVATFTYEALAPGIELKYQKRQVIVALSDLVSVEIAMPEEVPSAGNVY